MPTADGADALSSVNGRLDVCSVHLNTSSSRLGRVEARRTPWPRPAAMSGHPRPSRGAVATGDRAGPPRSSRRPRYGSSRASEVPELRRAASRYSRPAQPWQLRQVGLRLRAGRVCDSGRGRICDSGRGQICDFGRGRALLVLKVLMTFWSVAYHP